MTTLQPSREYAPGGIHNGRAAVHLVNDVIANLLRCVVTMEKYLQRLIPSITESTMNALIARPSSKQACADIEYKRRGKCDERIADEQRFADIKTLGTF